MQPLGLATTEALRVVSLQPELPAGLATPDEAQMLQAPCTLFGHAMNLSLPFSCSWLS